MKRLSTIAVASSSVLLSTASLRAQGFVVDTIRIGTNASNTRIDNLREAIHIYEISQQFDTGQTGVISTATTSYDIAEVRRGDIASELNFHGGGQGDPGRFAGDNFFGTPGATNVSNFLVVAKASLTIPAGTWQIGFGSDDGGFLRLQGLDFTSVINANGSDGSDTLFFNNPRATGYTLGTITLTEAQTVNFEAMMHERTGADAFEVVVRDASITGNLSSVDSTNWKILADGVEGFQVNSASPEPSTGLFTMFAGLRLAVLRRRRD